MSGGILSMMCLRHGPYVGYGPEFGCDQCRKETNEGKLYVTKESVMMNHPDASAIASFRYRLREASRLALEIGDRLLQMSQDASEPNVSQLKTLREMENSLDCVSRYYVRDIDNTAIRT